MDILSPLISFFFYTALYLPLVVTILCCLVFSIYRFYSYGPVVYHVYDQDTVVVAIDTTTAAVAGFKPKEVNADKLKQAVRHMVECEETKTSRLTRCEEAELGSPKVSSPHKSKLVPTGSSKVVSQL